MVFGWPICTEQGDQTKVTRGCWDSTTPQNSTATRPPRWTSIDSTSPSLTSTFTLLFLQLQAVWPSVPDTKFASMQTRVPALPLFF